MTLKDISRDCDNILCESLSPALREAIDNALRLEASSKDVLRLIAEMIADNHDGQLVYLACEAYLERKQQGV